MTRRPTARPIRGDEEYRVSLEWRARLQACLDHPERIGVGLDEDTRADILRGYEMHLGDVSRRIGEYEAARDGTPAPSQTTVASPTE